MKNEFIAVRSKRENQACLGQYGTIKIPKSVFLDRPWKSRLQSGARSSATVVALDWPQTDWQPLLSRSVLCCASAVPSVPSSTPRLILKADLQTSRPVLEYGLRAFSGVGHDSCLSEFLPFGRRSNLEEALRADLFLHGLIPLSANWNPKVLLWPPCDVFSVTLW